MSFETRGYFVDIYRPTSDLMKTKQFKTERIETFDIRVLAMKQTKELISLEPTTLRQKGVFYNKLLNTYYIEKS